MFNPSQQHLARALSFDDLNMGIAEISRLLAVSIAHSRPAIAGAHAIRSLAAGVLFLPCVVGRFDDPYLATISTLRHISATFSPASTVLRRV